MTKRSGSDTRQRQIRHSFRVNEKENQTIKDKADHAGIPVSALIRYCVLNVPPPRTSRNTRADKVLGAFMGQVGKIGGNINQLTKHYNAGHPMHESLELTLRELRQLRAAIMEAANRENPRPIDPIP